MKKIFLFILLFLCSVQNFFAQNKDYAYTAVPFTSVKLTDNFWLPRIRINHTVTIPASFERCEKTGRVKNFTMAAEKKGKFCTTYSFDDTDIYKTIEGASFSLSLFPDKKLETYIDSLITIVGKAQEPDGYLYTARTIDPLNPHKWAGPQRWVKERELSHELYNAGHLYESAVAHFMATGKRNLLGIAIKNADLVCSVFGSGKMHVAPGHEIVEMGLVKLYRITGKKVYLETAKDIDVLEKILYNGLISGVGLDGKSFFYTNAMQVRHNFKHSDMEGERSGWFECSCCPTNICRLLPSMPGYMYAQKDDKVFVNLFAASTTSLKVQDKTVEIIQQNNYPWDGDLKFTVSPKSSFQTFSLMIRIPGWAQNAAIPSDLYSFQTNSNDKPVIRINAVVIDYKREQGYAVINRAWTKNNLVELNLPMEVRRVIALDKLKDDVGKTALQRGPIMYCAEWPDNNGRAVNIVLPAGTVFSTEFKPAMLNSITIVKAEATAVVTDEKQNTVSTIKQPFVAIPYYAWANRGKGEMTVWFPEKLKEIEIVTN